MKLKYCVWPLKKQKIVELQKKLDRKSAAWNALEVKRIEYSAYLAIYSIQLANIISNTNRSSKMYGIEYSSDSNPRDLIRAGLRKAGIRPVPVEEPPKPSEKKKSGCTGFVVLMLFAFVLAIILAGLHNSTTHEKQNRFSSSEYDAWADNPLWNELPRSLRHEIRQSIPVQRSARFFKHLRIVRQQSPSLSEKTHIHLAIFHTRNEM